MSGWWFCFGMIMGSAMGAYLDHRLGYAPTMWGVIFGAISFGLWTAAGWLGERRGRRDRR